MTTSNRSQPARRWTAARAAIRNAAERHRYDAGQGVFTQAFHRPELDAALLRLPSVGFTSSPVAGVDELAVQPARTSTPSNTTRVSGSPGR
jgi:hypothetical protein